MIFAVDIQLRLSEVELTISACVVRAEERSSSRDICSLVDGDVFECLREVVRAVQRYCSHSA